MYLMHDSPGWTTPNSYGNLLLNEADESLSSNVAPAPMKATVSMVRWIELYDIHFNFITCFFAKSFGVELIISYFKN